MSTHSNQHINPSSSDESNRHKQAINKFKKAQKKEINISRLAQAIFDNNTVALSRGITLTESAKPEDYKKAQELVSICLSKANNSIRIGITGVPGVGKSTFIEALGSFLTQQDKKVAVLAVDPSSTISNGSILGDKTRMESLVSSTNAFIRPSPSGKSLGGVAQRTRESIILCEAAGYEIIIIETVGVGQSETTVHSMVDFFLLLKLAGAGDELQGIKRGIIEMADAIVINKADGDNVIASRKAKNQFNKALHFYPLRESNWTPKVTVCSALEHNGIENIWKLILEYTEMTKENGYFSKNRKNQNEFWLTQTIENALKKSFYTNPYVKTELNNQLKLIEQEKITPFKAAENILSIYTSNSSTT